MQDEVWREKKRVLENDLGAAWKKIALLEKVAEAAIAGPCRHTSDYKGTDCPLCAALDALIAGCPSCSALRARVAVLEKVAETARNVMTLFDYPTAYHSIKEQLVGELRATLSALHSCTSNEPDSPVNP